MAQLQQDRKELLAQWRQQDQTPLCLGADTLGRTSQHHMDVRSPEAAPTLQRPDRPVSSPGARRHLQHHPESGKIAAVADVAGVH